MFSSQSTLNSVGRNAGISTTSSNYWYTEDNYPYVNLYPTGSTINTTEIDTTNNILYLGGSFSRLYQNNANYHSIYDVSSSSFNIKSKSYGTNGSIYAYGLDTSNNILYVGGNFTSVTDNNDITIDASYVAAWSIKKQRWTPLGRTKQNGLNGVCNAIAVDVSNQEVYVGGNFTKVSDASQIDQSANYVAKWTVSTGRWSKLGASDVSYNNGLKSMCRSLAYDSKNTQLYVGGDFTTARDASNIDITSNCVVIWKPLITRWSVMGNSTRNGLDGSCNAMALDSSNNRLYVGGNFKKANDTSNTDLSVNSVAYWDITNSVWKPLGGTTITTNGLDNSCNALVFDSSRNRLYVGGNFKKVSDSSKADQSANYVAFWDASNSLWGQIGAYDSSKNGVDASVNALAFDSCNNILYVGGNFLKAYDSSFTLIYPLSTQYLATWNPNTKLWSRVGYSSTSRAALYGLSNFCRALTYDPSKSSVYVGGDHTSTCDSTNISIDASNIAYINLNTSNIYPLGSIAKNGTNDKVNSIKLDTSNNVLYVDGSFTTVYDNSNTSLSANYIAKYDVSNSAWSRLGSSTSNGLGGMGKALFYDNTNNAVYASGNFTALRDSTIDSSKNFNYVAKWDVTKSAWSPMGSYGNGTNGTILAYAYDSANYRVFCGGSFTQVYDNSNTRLYANNVAIFNVNTSTWSVLGGNSVTDPSNNGVNSTCRTLVYDQSNNNLYVGGDFTRARDSRGYDLSTNCIAQWNVGTSTWSQVSAKDISSNGLDGSCNAIVYDTSNSNLYVGGTFNYSNYGPLYYFDASAIFGATFESSTVSGTTVSNIISGSGIGSATLIGDASVNSTNSVYGKNCLDLSKNSTTSYLQLPNLPSTITPLTAGSGFSISYWIYNSTLIAYYDTSPFQIADSTASNYLTISFGTNAEIHVVTANGGVSSDKLLAVPYGAWVHVIVTIAYTSGTASSVTIYINGGDYSTTTATGYYPNTSTSYTNNYLGYSSINRANATQAKYDECYIYQKVLTASEAKLIYNKGIGLTASNSSINSKNVAKFNVPSSLWTSLGGTTSTTNGIDGSCNALALDSSYTRLYVGGNFKKVSDSSKIDQSANYIAYWDISNSLWGKLGASDDSSNNGVRDIVRTLAYDNKNAQLYVGGDFIYARDGRSTDISINRVAIWKPSTKLWRGTGNISSNGTNGVISSQKFDSSNNVLYIGGYFTEVYDTSNIKLSVNNIAVWNIATKTWSRLGDSSLNGIGGYGVYTNVYSLCLNKTKLYVGGAFSEVYDKSNNTLYNVNLMAEWDLTTNTWSRMGDGSTSTSNGCSDEVHAMALDASNQVLYVGSNTRGGTLAYNVYDLSGTTNVGGIAAFNLSSRRWSRLGSSSSNGVRSFENAWVTLAFDNSNSSLYVGAAGNSTITNVRDDRGIDISINSIARWDVRTQKWFGLGGHSSNGTNGQINAYAYDGSRNRMYVGGGFTKVYDLSQIWLDVSNVAAWDIAGKYWVRLGSSGARNGVDASVNALAIDSSYSRLYVGGNFKKMSDASKTDQSANYVVYWDISNSLWGQMGGSTTLTNGLDGSCNALSIDNSNGRVYVGGNFRKVSDSTTVDQSANYVAYWNISDNTWSRLGATDVSYNNGLNQQCRSLVYDPSKTQLYVGGDFTAVRDSRNSDILANRIAIWKPSTTQWSVMGTTSNNGLDGSCNALALDSSKNRLYVGGNFKKVSDASQSDQSANYIAYWDLSNSLWFKLGGTDISKNGLDGSCNALIYDNSNNRLYVGGSFKKVSDSSQIDQSANYVAYWDVSNSIWKQLGGTTSTRNGASDIVNALEVDVSKNVFAGGRFISVNDSAYNTYLANYAAFWSPSTSRWSRLGSIVKNGLATGTSADYAQCLEVDTSNSILYGPWSSNASNGYYDVSNSTALAGKSLCAWDIKNECWFYMTGSSSIATANYLYGAKLDSVKKRLYLYFYNGSIIPDPSNGVLKINGVVYYDIITKRIYPLGGANNSYATFTNGVLYYNGSSYSNTSPSITFACETDNSGNAYFASSTSYTPTTYNVACDNNRTQLFKSIVMWDASNSQWNVLGSNPLNGIDASCISMVYDNSNQELYVSGYFANTTDSVNDYLPRNLKTPISKVAKWSVNNSRWSNIGGQRFDASNGTNGAIYASVYDSCKNIIYVGGNFTIVSDTSNGDLSANYIAAWDVSAQYWSRLGTAGNNGLNGICNALAIDSSKQILYVGGQFNNVFDATYLDQSVNFVASWNISSGNWSLLGASETVNGLDGSCNALALDSSNSRLYVGGNFLKVSDSSKADQSANYVAYWDISNSLWKKLGANDDSSNNGVKSVCRTLVYDNSNSQLYVGGDFLYVRDNRRFDISTNRIAIWKSSTLMWSGMGGIGENGTNGQIFAYVYDSCKNVMYAGGSFTTVYDSSNINGLSANRIAKWDIATSLWSRLTDSSWNGVDASCNALAMDTSNQILYVGGNFTTVYDSSNTNTLTNTQRVASWNVNTSTWSRLGSSTATTNGLTSTGAYCNAMVYDSSNSRLYVGGNFTTVGDASYADFSANYVAYWNISTSRWSNLGASDVSYNNGLKTMCRSLAYDSKNTQLYVGGDFTQVRDSRGIDLSINRIAKWDVSNSLWVGMGNVGSNGTNYVSGTSGRIFANVYDSCKNYIYVSGDFTYLYDNTNIALSANYIAYWDITNQKWGRLGTASSNGLSGSVYTTFQSSTYGSRFSGLAIDSSRQILYVSNLMTSVNDASGTLSNVKYIAAWNINTQRWSRLGGSTTTNNGTSGICASLAYDSRNNRLHVGGQCSIVYDTSNGSQTVNNIASWDVANNCWLPLGSGLNSSVFSMAMDVSNNYLWVTGAFYQGTDSSGVKTLNSCAYWNFNNSRWYPLGTTAYNGYAFYTNQTSSSILDASNSMFYVTIANSIQGGGTTIPFYDATSTTGLTAYNIAAYNISTSTWQLLGNSTYNGIAGNTMRYIPMFALDTSNSILYLSGNFTSVSDPTNTSQSVNYIAGWNIRTQKWSRLGTSTSNGITNNDNTESNGGAPMAMSVDSSCNLYVGSVGANVYDSTGTVSLNGVASWSPSTQRWYRLGTTISNGLDGSCNAIALDSSNNRLYVGGNFKKANDSSNTDLSTNCVAYWDISNSVWKTLGGTSATQNGLDGSCNALVFDSSRNRLYVGGNFKKVSDSSKSDQSANYVVYWDVLNSLWGQMGGSTSTTTGVDGSVNALAFDSNRNLFVGGVFANARSTSGDISANKAIIWSTSNKWTTLGVGLYQNGVTDGSVNALALDETNQRLYVGGSFSKVKDSSNAAITTNKIAYWDLNTNTWNALGTTDISKNGVNAICRTLNYNSSKTTLYAGGDFTRVSDSTGYDLSANRIASWNQSTGIWTPFGSAYRNANNGLNNSVYTISTAKNNQVFVGGTFTGGNDISGSITSNYGMIWNPSSYKWSKFGGYSGIRMDGSVNAFAIDSSFTKLFLGGTFSRMSDNCGNSYTVNNGAIWNINSQSLSAIGSFNLNGLNFYPNTFAMDTYNNVVYMGGNFTTAYDASNSSSSIFAMYVIGYDITNNKWIQLGNEAFNGVTGEVTSLAFDQENYILYVSGNYNRMFDGTNGLQSVNYIAAYNVYSKTWGRLGSSTYNGTNIAPNSIAFNSSNNLYVGGNFTSVYDSSNATLTVKYMATWNITNSTWSRIGANSTYNGVDASINILQYNSSSNYLLTVGNFSNINDSVNTKVRQVSTYATYKF